MTKNTWVSWSSGKDSAFTLFKLQQLENLVVKSLITTVNKDYERVAMHSTRLELLKLQAKSLELPLEIVEIPKDCSNEIYEESFKASMEKAIDQNISSMAFGDLFLEDIKNYREKMFEDSLLEPTFPLWQMNTTELAKQMIDLGFEIFLTCIDPKKLPTSFAGRKFDHQLLEELPSHVDPCGENGEFHTFVANGPNFTFPISCSVGDIVERDGFIFADIVPL